MPGTRLIWCMLVPCMGAWPWPWAWEKHSKVYFMLTSTPSRAHLLPRLLANMRKQTRRPDGVILSIPHKYSRFSGPFHLPPHGDALLVVNYLSADAGPLSKYMGVMKVPEPRATIIIGDDDVDYGKTFIEDFVAALAVRQDMKTVVAAQFDRKFGRLSPGVMAFAGVGCYAKQLKQLVQSVHRGPPLPGRCFLADDVVATHYFKVVGGIPTCT